MDDTGGQPQVPFYPSTQPGIHPSQAQPYHPTMQWQPPQSQQNYQYFDQQHNAPAWSSGYPEAHGYQYYNPNMPMSPEGANYSGANSVDYHNSPQMQQSMYMPSHEQAAHAEYYGQQHYYPYDTSGIQTDNGASGEVHITGYPPAPPKEVLVEGTQLPAASAEGWDDADLNTGNDAMNWNTYDSNGNSYPVGQTDAVEQDVSAHLPAEPAAVVAEQAGEHSAISSADHLTPHDVPTAVGRNPQMSECSDMEMYWKETRQPFYNAEASHTNPPDEDNQVDEVEMGHSDQQQAILLQKFNRQDSTWASPMLDSSSVPVVHAKDPLPHEIATVFAPAVSETVSPPVVTNATQGNDNVAAPESTASISGQSDDYNAFHKAVGAERHKDSIGGSAEPVQPSPGPAFEPLAPAPTASAATATSKNVVERLHQKLAPLRVSTRLPDPNASSTSPETKSSAPHSSSTGTAPGGGVAMTQSAFTTIQSRRRGEPGEEAGAKKAPVSQPSRWQQGPHQATGAQPGLAAAPKVVAGGTSAPANTVPPRGRASPRTYQPPSSTVPTRPTNLGKSTAGPPSVAPNVGSTARPLSSSQQGAMEAITARYASRRFAGGGGASPAPGLAQGDANGPQASRTPWRPQTVSGTARPPVGKRGMESNMTTSAFPWRPSGNTTRTPRGPASTKDSQGGSDYGEAGARCASRTSLSSEGHYGAYPLSPESSRKPDDMYWQYYQAMMSQYSAGNPQTSSMYQPGSAAQSGYGTTSAFPGTHAPGGMEQVIQAWRDYYSRLAVENGVAQEDMQSIMSEFFSAMEIYQQASTRIFRMATQKPGRLTPKLFATPHRIVSVMHPGLLLQVPAHRPDEGQPAVVELQTLPGWEEERAVHATFPGPLSREATLKGEVRAYLRNRLADTRQNMPPQWDSVCLLLTFLDSLVQANGHLEQTELAKLLMEGHEPRTEDLRPTAQLLAASETHSQLMMGEDERFASLPPSEPPSGRASPAVGHSRPQSRAASILSAATDTLLRSQALARQNRGITGGLAASGLGHYSMEQADRFLDQYRLLIMRNEKLQALEYSCKHGLWGCAFALASQLPNSQKLLPTVLARFLHQAVQISDPLQTLHQLLAGQVPAFLRNGLTGPGANAEWGDWRPHLAMILSAQSQQPQLAISCMNHLGDNLGAARILYAAQLCYIFAGSAFSTANPNSWSAASSSADKVTLIGADFHRRAMRQIGEEFLGNEAAPNLVKRFEENMERYDPLLAKVATEEAIQLTEIFEYACSLKQKDFYLPHLVPFKFLYALRLLDAGFFERAFRYCKIVSVALRQRPELYSRSLFQRLLSVSERLRFHPECSHIDSFEESVTAADLTFSAHPPANWIEVLRATYQSCWQVPKALSASSFTSQQSPPQAPAVPPGPPPVLQPPSTVSTMKPSEPVPVTDTMTTMRASVPPQPQHQHHPPPSSAHNPPPLPPPPQPSQVAPPPAVSGGRIAQQQVHQNPQHQSYQNAENSATGGIPAMQYQTIGQSGGGNMVMMQDESPPAGSSTYTSPMTEMPPPVNSVGNLGYYEPPGTGMRPHVPMNQEYTLDTSAPSTTSNYKYLEESSPPPYGQHTQQHHYPDNTRELKPVHEYDQTDPSFSLGTSTVQNSSGRRTSTPTVTPARPQQPRHQNQHHAHPPREEPPRDSPPPGMPYKPPSLGFFVPQPQNDTTESVDSGSGAGFDYFGPANEMFRMHNLTNAEGTEETDGKNSVSQEATTKAQTAARVPPSPPAMVTKPETTAEKSAPRGKDSAGLGGKGDKDDPSRKAGWLPTIRLPWAKKNVSEIILPDDSKQQIQWDPVKKCWVDTSADPTAEQKEDTGPPRVLAPPNPSGPVGMPTRTSSRYVGLPTAMGATNGPPMPPVPVPTVPLMGGPHTMRQQPMGMFVPPMHQDRNGEE